MSAYSAIIPVHNGANFVIEALDSIARQTVPASQIIVVDDGSVDNTVELVRDACPDAAILTQSNAGPGSACNLGIGHARTPVLAFLDHDDLWLPNKMERQLAHLDRDGGPEVSACRIRTFEDGERADENGPVSDGLIRSGLVLRTEWARRAGPLRDGPGKAGEMIDWVARMREMGARSEVLPEILALRRSHADNNSRKFRAEANRGILEAARRALERRRSGSQA